MELTVEQQQSFEEKGYLVLRHFVDEARCEAILDVAKAHLKHRIPPIETESEYNETQLDSPKPTVRRLRQVYSRDILFREWMEDAKMRPILRKILGQTPILTLAHHNSIMTKMPQTSTQTSWHQDIRYWNYQGDALVSVWLALGEERGDNGVLEFIPGSHRMRFDADCFDEKIYFKSDYPKNQSIIATKEQTILERGDVVLFHSKLLHRANKNSTKEPKISFVYTVRAISNKPLAGTRSSAFGEVILD